MKVLFAISTEKGANQIIDFYKSTYGEKIEATKVFFFRALLETLRKNKEMETLLKLSIVRANNRIKVAKNR